MIVVGVDFGTTNVRIATWESDGDLPPDPIAIGSGSDGTTAMPAVVALRRQPGGDISVIVGEEADSEIDDPNDTVVIRNIKRYALSNDAYVSRYLEVANVYEKTPKWPPTWWNPQEHCVEVWGRRFPVWDLIGSILAEAFRRADVGEAFEWRAGCPVHAGFDYRRELTRALCQVTGNGNIDWIVQEPILFMTLAYRLGGLDNARIEGSYLVYDFGGGSFDCALVEIAGDGEMTVYGADGHPLLGGADIDQVLTDRLSYRGQTDLLRKAKERLSPTNPSETLADGTAVTIRDLESTLAYGEFVEQSLNSMRDAYMVAKVVWKRYGGEDDPPIGPMLTRSGPTSFVWELSLDDLARDVDGIILFGGPTKSSYFRQRLSAQFGEQKIKDASELLHGVSESELVGVSMGACYSYQDSYSPLYVNRLPVRVVLENLQSGDRVEYEPFESFTQPIGRFDPFVSAPLSVQPALVDRGMFGETIRLTISRTDGSVQAQTSIDEIIDTRLIGYTLKLVIDRYGRVGVEQTHVRTTGDRYRMPTKRFMIFSDTPWQTGLQRRALQRLFEQESEFQRRHDERTSSHINRRPWDYPLP